MHLSHLPFTMANVVVLYATAKGLAACSEGLFQQKYKVGILLSILCTLEDGPRILGTPRIFGHLDISLSSFQGDFH